MPRGFATSMMSRVILTSAEDGVGSPEGWLWTRIRADAESSSARFTTSRGIDRRVVDGARLLHLVGDQRVALVEEEQAELLLVHEGHGRAAIVEHRGPGREDRALGHRALGEAPRRGLDDLEVGDDALADAVDLGEARGRRGEHLGEGAEAPDQLLGDRLHVAARDGAEEHELEQLVVGQRIAADLDEAGAQPVTVTVVVRRRAPIARHQRARGSRQA